MYVVSEATILLGHVPRHLPITDAPFPMSCYTDVFPGQQPPSTHSFPYKSCLLFCFLFLFVLIPTVISRLLRGNDHDQHNHLLISDVEEEDGEGEKSGLGLVKSSAGLLNPRLNHIHMALMEGPSFLCQRQQEELDFCLFF